MRVRPKTTREYNVYQDAWVDESEAVTLLIQLMSTLPATDVYSAVEGWKAEQARKREEDVRRQQEEADARDRRMNSPA